MDTSREGSWAADSSTQQPVDSVFLLGELNPYGGGDPIPLLRAKLLIGRRSSCDISLHFPNISSHHCELKLINGYWYVRDLSSRNGVKVNGERCESKWLMPGDILSIAKHRYEMLYSPQGEAPPLEEEDPFAKGLLEKAGLEHPSEAHWSDLQTDQTSAQADQEDLARGSDVYEQNPAFQSEQKEELRDHPLFPEEADIETNIDDNDDLATHWLNNID